jgi:hypothetical protein
MNYIPHVTWIPSLEHGAKKEKRGFNHPSTARLLCPQHLLEEFDKDMDAFCQNVQNGSVLISHDDWLSFLYPEDAYYPNAIDKNLLRGPFLLSVSLCSPFEPFLMFSTVTVL